MVQKGTDESASPEELTLSQIFEKYKDNWVAIEVTKRDRNSQPVRGRVVENDIDRYRLSERTAKLADICILYAGEPEYRLIV